MDGKYYWVPFSRIREITLEAPKDLRDLVWAPAILMLSAGAQKVALLPARYPGTERSGDGALLLARKTEWVEKGDGTVGLGPADNCHRQCGTAVVGSPQDRIAQRCAGRGGNEGGGGMTSCRN